MTEEEALERLKDHRWRISHLYKIQTKDAKLATFKPNIVQEDFLNCRTNKNIVLKARQMGFTTLCCIDMLDDTITNPNKTGAIIAHTRDDAAKLFEITKRAFSNIPEEIRPKAAYDNRNELYFGELDSKIYVDTDLRGGTTHNLHISEVAFIDRADQKMAGILETVPDSGSITLESTANGIGGYFNETWEDPKSEFKKHFYNWLWDIKYQIPTTDSLEEMQREYKEYVLKYGLIDDVYNKFHLTPEQFNFYLSKIRRQKHLVMQEYPMSALEAFISTGRNVFSLTDLQRHKTVTQIDNKWNDVKIWEYPLKGFRYVIGCDPAEGLGGDYSVIEVFNADTGEQAAEFVSNSVAPDRLSHYLYEIGKYFNNAYINIEVNNHGRTTIDNLKHRYYNIYRRKVFDKVANKDTEALGWRTTGVTKPLLVDNLEEAIRDMSLRIKSEYVIKEMRSFVQSDEPGKKGFGGEGSAHDDSVIACGLALQAIKNLPRAKKPETLAQKKMKEYIKSYGIPSYIQDTVITSRNRPNYSIRKSAYAK